MTKIEFLIIPLFSPLVFGCSTSATAEDSEVGNRYVQFGYFTAFPDLRQIISINKWGKELYYSSSDVPEVLISCANENYKICLYADNGNLAFVVPDGEIKKGDRWSMQGYEFELVESFESNSIIDARLPTTPKDWMRFQYYGGAIKAFSYGDKKSTAECPYCFDARITYVWSGSDSWWREPYD